MAVAVSPDGTTAYVANSGNNTVSIVPIAGGAVTTVAVGTNPEAVAVTPDGQLVYVANTGSASVSVISTVTRTVVGTIDLPTTTADPADPSALSVTPDGSTVWVAATGTDAVYPIAVAPGGGTLGGPVTVGIAPDALAVTPDGSVLLVANGGSGSVTPIGLTVPNTPDVGAPEQVGGNPDALAVTPDGTTVLVAEASAGELAELSVGLTAGRPALTAGPTIALGAGSSPHGVAVMPDQHPVASLTVTPAEAGSATLLDASSSFAPSSAIASYLFTFGDGSPSVLSPASVPAVSHVYAKAGSYTATVTVTDVDGTSTSSVFTGQTASGAGGPTAEASQTFAISAPVITVPPVITSVAPSAGPTGGGTVVTVSGADFIPGATQVTFGAAGAGLVESGTTTSLQVVAPPGPAGPVNVTASTVNGKSLPVPADQFTYVAPPSVSSVRPTTGPTTGGEEVVIRGADLAAATSVDFGAGNPGRIVSSSTGSITVVSPAGTAGATSVIVTSAGGTSAASPGSAFTYVQPAASGIGGCASALTAAPVVGMAATGDGSGYWVVDALGEVAAFGDATCYGSLAGHHLNQPIVGIAADGGIFAFDAPFFGSAGAIHLNAPIVGMSATPDGGGYRFVASDGGVFAYGDASFLGSMGGKPLDRPIVGMATSVTGDGYWLVASDGGVFSFGDATFEGSMGGKPLNQPIVGIAADPVTGGYWLVAADGGIFAFGAPFFGSTGSDHLNRPIVGMAPSPDGGGYWFVAADGGVFAFGDAPFAGSAVGT